jgi:hypothetical protein
MSNNIVEPLILITPSVIILALICAIHSVYKEYEGIREEEEYLQHKSIRGFFKWLLRDRL